MLFPRNCHSAGFRERSQPPPGKSPLSARIAGATFEIVCPQNVGRASRPVGVLTTVAAPPAMEPTPSRLVGQANGEATPPEQTCGASAKIPFELRAGLSNNVLFQIVFA